MKQKKQKSKVKLALAMIVKGSDSEAERLTKCLSLTAEHVDGIFITITQPNEKVEEACKLFNAKVSHFEWCDDFAKARNFNFSQVPKEFTHILWLDADDGLRGAELLKPTIEEHLDADVFSIYYLYAFDENKNPIVVHPKTQILKNDGCVEWAGALHEDFKENRSLVRYFIKDIERIHLTDDKRINENKERNLRISQKQIENEPNDPRSYWNVGNSLKALGRNQEAIDTLKKFIEMSLSDDEKYIAHLRIAESYWLLGERNKALDEAAFAIGTKPEYPDAYHLKGSLLQEMKRFEEAIVCYRIGLTRKPPQYKIIVHNPRDYDYVPLMNMAKCYYSLNFPSLALPLLKGCSQINPKDKSLKDTIKIMEQESEDFNEVTKLIVKLSKIKSDKKLKEEMEKIPLKYKSHPGLCKLRNERFVKAKSSGKDLVIMCGYTVEEWSPETAKKKGIGGSEEAVIHLAKLWSKAGYNVEVYNNCGEIGEYDGVTYKPYWMWNFRDKQDITILWRAPRYAEYGINSDKIYLDLHDVIQPGELNEKRLEQIDKIFVKSDFHKSLFPHVESSKFVVVPNGIVPSIFAGQTKRDKNLIINTSSPDRSLSALLDVYEIVKKEVPNAKLKWAYGWGVFDAVHGSNPKIMAWKDEMKKRMSDLGVEELGRVNHGEVAELYRSANIFLYPTEFAEIDCISMTKAQASGCVPIATDFAALGEKQRGGYFWHSTKTKDDWAKPYQNDFGLESKEGKEWLAQCVIKTLKNPPTETERTSTRIWAMEKFNWENIANIWINEFNSKN